jgi:Uncharacterized conserved protein (COG2071)
MMLEMTVRDCLYLNWALPADALPAPPRPLRYQVHAWQGRDVVFASALLFHQDAVHLSAFPIFHFGYPQLNLRLNVLDGEGVPAVFFHSMLMPSWVVPGVRLVSHQPASSARLDFPRPSRNAGDGPWLWRVRRGGSLEVLAWQDSPRIGDGPRIGSWEQTVRYFDERQRGYVQSDGVLHRIEARHPNTANWPLRVELRGDDVLGRLLPLAGTAASGNGSSTWPGLHSAWLCPEIPFVFELGLVPKVQVSPGMPQPAAGRVASPALVNQALVHQALRHRERSEPVGVEQPSHRPSRESAGLVLASRE